MKRIDMIFISALIFMLFIVGLNQNVCAQVTVQDSLVLVALYDSTDGPNWSNKSNWLTEQPVATWYGIGVSNGRIATIELGDNNLNGTIPPSIGDLDSLDYLSFYSNQLVDSIPSEIGDLTHLTMLDLSLNHLTGPIPPTIGNLTNLININLRSNKLTGSIPMEIGSLINLSSLYLNSNGLSGSIPATLGDLTNLTDLSLHTNSLSDSIPPELGSLTNLTSMDLGINNLSGSIPLSFTYLTQLTNLNLRNNKLTGAIPPEIGNLKNLIYLSLNNNQFSESIPVEIWGLTNLTYLALYNNQLNGTIPAKIDSLTHLKYLKLEGNQLSGTVPSQIAHLSLLETLTINDNQLVDLPALDSLTVLITLTIQNNQFTFEDIEPNVGVASGTFTYSPQDSLGIGSDTTLNVGDSLMLSVSVGGTANEYQWIKNGTYIVGATASIYTIESFDSSDAGSYVCGISNTIASDLTLYSRAINIAGTRIDGISNHSIQKPKVFVLHPNYPNPFNPTTTIRYQLPAVGDVELSIFNLIGQKVITLVSKRQSAGYYKVNWDASGFASGVYYYQLHTDTGFIQIKKLVLLK